MSAAGCRARSLARSEVSISVSPSSRWCAIRIRRGSRGALRRPSVETRLASARLTTLARPAKRWPRLFGGMTVDGALKHRLHAIEHRGKAEPGQRMLPAGEGDAPRERSVAQDAVDARGERDRVLLGDHYRRV